MAPFDECCVLIPAATLEDFPADANDSDACSLLAGWTSLWHPKLLAQTEQTPTWYRADSPPEPDGPRIVVVPQSSLEQLPSDFQGKCDANKDCQWVTGANRREMLASMGLSDPMAELVTSHRTISVEDFFAAGYAALQIQIMTRRLRYTSNLDEIYLQKQIVEAAQAFIAGNAETTATALHNVFDCLAEERDHYFTSDPHLIDLNLLTPKTLDELVESGSLQLKNEQEHTARLDTPENVLIDAEVAEYLVRSGEKHDGFREVLSSGKVGWVGGGPAAGTCFDAMTFDEAESLMASAHSLATSAIGAPPVVYGRFSGSTPADLTPALVRLGYAGMIPIDFARGSGFGDESKVIQQAGGAEIESLTAKPMDASSDAAFLSLGARLGEAIDSGEIATALLAHWPGQGCDAFHDLRRVASWCLALGRFWKLDDYFREGEHPYHHGTTRSVATDSHEALTEQVVAGTSNAISSAAEALHQSLRSEFKQRCRGMAELVSGKTCELESLEDIATEFAKATGAEASESATAKMLINPSSVSQRCTVMLNGQVSDSPKHIYAVSTESNMSVVSVDVPAGGFAVIQSGGTPSRPGLFKKLFSKSQIAEGNSLQNEFMEVVVSEETGGIQGVYSGATRGNRFSMRLVYVDQSAGKSKKDKGDDESSVMKCKSFRVAESNASMGAIEVAGTISDGEGNVVADFDLRYELQRGCRWVHLTGRIEPKMELRDTPWKHYIGARAVVASESAVTRLIVRDKLHRARNRRLVAPLGLVLDEAERQTLLGANGLPYHRRVGDRFLDTLLSVKGQSGCDVAFSYGFDQPDPVGNAKSLICRPLETSINASDQLPATGWITHVAPREAMISRLEVRRRDDGLLAARLRIIQTRNKSASMAIRFCRDVAFATGLDSGTKVGQSTTAAFNQPLPESSSEDDAAANVGGVNWKGDTVRSMISGHQVTDLLVVFKA